MKVPRVLKERLFKNKADGMGENQAASELRNGLADYHTSKDSARRKERRLKQMVKKESLPC